MVQSALTLSISETVTSIPLFPLIQWTVQPTVLESDHSLQFILLGDTCIFSSNLIKASGPFACSYLSQSLAHLTFPFMLLASPQSDCLSLRPFSTRSWGVPGSGTFPGPAGLCCSLLSCSPHFLSGVRVCGATWEKLFGPYHSSWSALKVVILRYW